MLNFTKTEVLGLDIGSSSVKLVGLREDDAGYTVTAAGTAKIAVSEEDNNHRKINIVTAIRECLESTGRKTKLAVCGLSGQQVAVRDFEFPELRTEEIEQAVLFEASQVCPFNAADITIDYHLIPNADTHASPFWKGSSTDRRGDDKTRGILIAATNGLIKNKVQLAKEAALKCVLMDVEGLALLNCFNNLDDESEKAAIAILNVGGSGTTMAIMGVNGWPFIRDMTFAGDDIIKQIAAVANMSTQDVKGILFGDSAEVQKELGNSLEKASQKLVVGVTKTLRYYTAQKQSTTVEKIFVCGGFALAKGFVELLNSRLSAEVVLWNPFDKMRCDTGQQGKDIFNKKGPALAVAAGLAMRSI